ncbi:MAG: 4-hydroxyphenylacetate 3-monooxygenase, oxygenase component, partial [Bacillota bacterium]
MAVRTGAEFIENLRTAPRDVQVHGERLRSGIADHPAFRSLVRSYARLYDLQHEPALRDIMTYPSPTSGEPVGVSFLMPQTREDLEKRSRMIKVWADHSFGMLGRTADYLNAAVMAMAGAADWFAAADRRFGADIRK